MGREIERKFLVRDDSWRGQVQGVIYRQGYLCSAKERTVRVRVAGRQGFLTIKGLTVGASRPEYEYEIPVAEAEAMLDNLAEKPLIEKIRQKITYGGLIWEVDEFLGENAGLIVAEVELSDETQAFSRPPWAGEEVTADARYFNSNLSRQPFKHWETWP